MAGRQKNVDPDVKMSKALSWLLRHGAEEEGFVLLKGGFLYVEDILKHPKFKSASQADIQRIVETNEKQRFALETDAETQKLKIRANQGHTMAVEDLDLSPIEDPDKFPTVIHGTNKAAYKFIAKEGLNKMHRNHIHFASGEPGESGVISGMRQSCSVIIFIDLKKALSDGFQFFLSANGVILCPGNQQGILPCAYFQRVLDSTTRKKLPFAQDQNGHSSSTICDSIEQALPAVEESKLGAAASAATVSADDLADEFDDKKRRGKKKAHKS